MKIYSEKITPRLRYATQVVFKNVLNTEVELIKDSKQFLESDGPKLNYSKTDFENIPRITPTELLFQKDIFEQEVHMFDWDELPVFFRSRGNCIIPFDIFAATFYLVSRYEEYLPFIPDHHGRFTARESVAFKEGFLDKPLVNLWARQLMKELQFIFPEFKPVLPKFSYVTTIDVDNIYAYLGKGGFRTIGGIAKDVMGMNIENFRERIKTLIRMNPDPYDTFDWQQEVHKKYGVKSIYFMLFSEFSRFDRNVSMYHGRMRSTVKHYNDYTTLGIHPSYQSNSSKAILENEKTELEQLMGRPVTHSRQHFLKTQLPKTIRILSNLGIKDEYTMGYAWETGFRASICTPFSFYDLEMEVELPITMHPFAFMDMTYINYQNIASEDAWPKMKKLVDTVKSVDGQMISIWHNRTFSEAEPEWMGYNKVYEDLLNYCSPKQII